MPRTPSTVNLSSLLVRAFGTPIPSLSVRQMQDNGWADLSGRVFPRWDHAGGPRRSYDPTLAALDSIEQADRFADLDREHAAWEYAEGFRGYAPIDPLPPLTDADFVAIGRKFDAMKLRPVVRPATVASLLKLAEVA